MLARGDQQPVKVTAPLFFLSLLLLFPCDLWCSQQDFNGVWPFYPGLHGPRSGVCLLQGGMTVAVSQK